MSADEPKPPAGGGPGGATRDDGYSEAFQEAIAESNFFIQQGLYEEAVTVLEDLQKAHGSDPRIMGRLHVARTKLREPREEAGEPAPPVAKPKLTPPPGKPAPPVAKPKLTPPPGKPAPRSPVKGPAGPPPTITVPTGPLIDDAEPAPLPPVPEFEDLDSNAVTNPLSIPADLKSASPGASALASGRTPVTPLGRSESMEVELVLDPEEEPESPALVAAPVLPSVPPVESPAKTPVEPPVEPAPAMSVASAVPDELAVSAGSAKSPLKPFERKRAVLEPTRDTGRGRRKMILMICGVGLLLLVGMVALVIVLKSGGDKDDKASDGAGLASQDDSMQRPEPRQRPSARRRPAVDSMEPDSMSAMSRGTPVSPDAATQPNTQEPPSRRSGGEPSNPRMSAGDPEPSGGDSMSARTKVQLRLTIEPKRANAVVYFRGGKYITNRFVSQKVKSRSTEEVITIRARGYKKMELKLTLDQDLERTVKLKRRPRRMKLFDLGSKR